MSRTCALISCTSLQYCIADLKALEDGTAVGDGEGNAGQYYTTMLCCTVIYCSTVGKIVSIWYRDLAQFLSVYHENCLTYAAYLVFF